MMIHIQLLIRLTMDRQVTRVVITLPKSSTRRRSCWSWHSSRLDSWHCCCQRFWFTSSIREGTRWLGSYKRVRPLTLKTVLISHQTSTMKTLMRLCNDSGYHYTVARWYTFHCSINWPPNNTQYTILLCCCCWRHTFSESATLNWQVTLVRFSSHHVR